MKKAIYFNLKIYFFRYISIQSSSSQKYRYSLENGHCNLASYTVEQSREKDFSEMMHFARYVQYCHALLYKNFCSGGNDISNFVRTLLAFSYYVLTMSARCFGVKKRVLTININFIFFIPQLRPLRLRVMKFTRFRLLYLQMQ